MRLRENDTYNIKSRKEILSIIFVMLLLFSVEQRHSKDISTFSCRVRLLSSQLVLVRSTPSIYLVVVSQQSTVLPLQMSIGMVQRGRLSTCRKYCTLSKNIFSITALTSTCSFRHSFVQQILVTCVIFITKASMPFHFNNIPDVTFGLTSLRHRSTAKLFFHGDFGVCFYVAVHSFIIHQVAKLVYVNITLILSIFNSFQLLLT